MSRQQRRFDDADIDLEGRSRSTGMGSLVLATAIGIGIGMLAAPDAGPKTRRRLRTRLAALGEDLGDGLEEIQERGGRARKQLRDRLQRARKRGEEVWEDLEERLGGEEEEEEEEEAGSGALGTALAIAAGVAATYFLTSERAAPARSRVRQTAENVRREATDRWQRYQDRRRETGNGHSSAGTGGETRSGVIPSDEGPDAG
jgi:gas vesicle protein